LARSRPEVAISFAAIGQAWRQANAAHVSLGQLKVTSAAENSYQNKAAYDLLFKASAETLSARSSAGHSRARSMLRSPHRSFATHTGPQKNALPPTCNAIPPLNLPSLADLSCGPPAAKSPQ
jgi:hypothetical protein